MVDHDRQPSSWSTTKAMREALRDLLREDGRMVETYASSEAFLAAYRSDREGCLLVDARMPGCPEWAGSRCCGGSRARDIGCRRS